MSGSRGGEMDVEVEGVGGRSRSTVFFRVGEKTAFSGAEKISFLLSIRLTLAHRLLYWRTN
jgi:hypothetical protein